MRMEKIKIMVFLLIFLFISIFYSVTCETCKISVIKIEEVKKADNKINVTGTLSYYEVPRGRSYEELKEMIERGIYKEEEISKFVETGPIEGNISIYFNTSSEEILLCKTKSNSSGDFKCENIDVTPLMAKGCGRIKAVFEGKDDIGGTSGDIVFCPSYAIIPFGAIVDEKCMVIILIIGILIAAAYAAGFDPTKAFDITIPKIKGIKGYPGFKYKKFKAKPVEEVITVGKKIRTVRAAKLGAKLGIFSKAALEKYKKETELKNKMGILIDEMANKTHVIKKRIEVIDERLRRINKQKMLAKKKEELNKLIKEEKELLSEKEKIEKFNKIIKSLIVDDERIMNLKFADAFELKAELAKIRRTIIEKRAAGIDPKKEIEEMLEKIGYPKSVFKPTIRAIVASTDAKFNLLGKIIRDIKKNYSFLPSDVRRDYFKATDPQEKLSEKERIEMLLKVYEKINPEEAKLARKLLNELDENIKKNEKWFEKTTRGILENKEKYEEAGGDIIGRRRIVEETFERAVIKGWEDAVVTLGKRAMYYVERKGKEEELEIGRDEAKIISAITEVNDMRDYYKSKASSYIIGEIEFMIDKAPKISKNLSGILQPMLDTLPNIIEPSPRIKLDIPLCDEMASRIKEEFHSWMFENRERPEIMTFERIIEEINKIKIRTEPTAG